MRSRYPELCGRDLENVVIRSVRNHLSNLNKRARRERRKASNVPIDRVAAIDPIAECLTRVWIGQIRAQGTPTSRDLLERLIEEPPDRAYRGRPCLSVLSRGVGRSTWRLRQDLEDLGGLLEGRSLDR